MIDDQYLKGLAEREKLRIKIMAPKPYPQDLAKNDYLDSIIGPKLPEPDEINDLGTEG